MSDENVLRTYLTAKFDQIWAAAARSDAAAVAAAIDAIDADGFTIMAAAVRTTLFVHGRAAWTTVGFIELSEGYDDGAQVTVTGTILDWVPMCSKLGRAWAVLVLTDTAGAAIRVQVMPRTYDTFGHLIARGESVTVAGRIDRRDERLLLIARLLEEVTPAAGN